jgi:hypothetical protein
MQKMKKWNAKDAVTRCTECTRAGAQDREIEYTGRSGGLQIS